MANKRQSEGCLLLFFFFLLFEGLRGEDTKTGKNRGLGNSLCIESILKATLCYSKRPRFESGALDF